MSTEEDLDTPVDTQDEKSNNYNIGLLLKIVAVLSIIYLIYIYYKSRVSVGEYTPSPVPIQVGTATSSFDAVSTAFGH